MNNIPQDVMRATREDYEAAARAVGWYVNDRGNFETVMGTDIPDEITTFGPDDPDGGWGTLCDAEGIEVRPEMTKEDAILAAEADAERLAEATIHRLQDLRLAVEKAVAYAISVVGIDGLRQTSMFPSNERQQTKRDN